MPTEAWRSEDDLVGALESCTRELGTLCGGLEAQQLENECGDPDEDIDVGLDTLASLEAMTSQCAVLLASLETHDDRSDEETDEEEMTNAVDANHKKNAAEPQEEDPDESSHLEAGLAYELDSFADELNEFLASLREPNIDTNTSNIEFSSEPLAGDTGNLSDKKTIPSSADLEVNINADDTPVTTSNAADNDDENVGVDEADELKLTENTMDEIDEQNLQSCTNNEENVNSTAPVVSSDTPDDNIENTTVLGANAANLSHTNEVFSERTKKAIALHVKRIALQRKRRLGARSRLWYSDEMETEQHHVPQVKAPWSNFQRTSFQQHIKRQTFARRRAKQRQDTQRLVEAARLKGSKPLSYRRPQIKYHKSSKRSAQNASYLGQFKPRTVHFEKLGEYEPKYLCAVYLYGLRRLGTTYITFNSLDQLEQRVRERFAINQVASINREVTEVVIPQPALEYSNSRKRHVKRLQRVSTLENVHDGDTLCVTQNAYDDMAILCDWIQQRQRIVHAFQYEVRQPRTDVSSDFTDEGSIPIKPKTSKNKPQLWDCNGRSIGVEAKHGI